MSDDFQEFLRRDAAKGVNVIVEALDGDASKAGVARRAAAEIVDAAEKLLGVVTAYEGFLAQSLGAEKHAEIVRKAQEAVDRVRGLA